MMLTDVKTRSAYRAATRSKAAYFFVKRLTDIIVSFILIVVSMPVFLCICYLIYKREGRPIFQCEKCAGVSGNLFIRRTFRTMTNRSKVIRALPPHPFPETWKNGVPDQFSFQYSPMTTYTSLGLWLEKYYLDKLPLLYHVLIGQMSLVGPAPELQEIASHYNNNQAKRLSVKPGIIGYAKINGDSTNRYHQQIQSDLYYVRYCSYIFDLKIIVRAISQVFLR